MHQVNWEDVPNQITALMNEALAGEEVVFTRGPEAVLRLISVEHEAELKAASWKNEMQALRGSLRGIDTSIPREQDRSL